MARWVRASVDLDENLKVAAFALEVGVELDVAIARLLRLWGRVSLHRPETGLIGDVPDATLETWALWRGTPGAFARAVRAHFQDADGTIHDWWEWNGAALRSERLDRDRKRAARSGGKGKADAGPDGPPDAGPDTGPVISAPVSTGRGPGRSAAASGVGVSSALSADAGPDAGPPAAGVRTDGRTEESPPTNQPSTTSPSSARPVAQPWVAEGFWPDLERLLLAVPDPHSWAAEIRAHGMGMPGHGPSRTPAQLGQAIRDFLASGATQEARPSLKHFRGFIGRTDRAAGPSSPGHPAAPPSAPSGPRLREITK